ncbi:hypothetical protein [Leptospira kmetyi]|uniref:hypothetical protein n=1 Tax=Leptospira kmetyi TaxID=408139 RepID=UPI003EBDC9DE
MNQKELFDKTENALLDQIASTAKERLGSPFYFSVVFSFVFTNWDIFYILLFEKKDYPTFKWRVNNYSFNYWWPILVATGYSIFYGIPSVFSDYLSHVYKTIGENLKIKFSNNFQIIDKNTVKKIESSFNAALSENNDTISLLKHKIKSMEEFYHPILIQMFRSQSGITSQSLKILDTKNPSALSDKTGHFFILADSKDFFVPFNSPISIRLESNPSDKLVGLVVGTVGEIIFSMFDGDTKLNYSLLPVNGKEIIENNLAAKRQTNVYVSSRGEGSLIAGDKNKEASAFWKSSRGTYLNVGRIEVSGTLVLNIQYTTNYY